MDNPHYGKIIKTMLKTLNEWKKNNKKSNKQIKPKKDKNER